jgi:AbrB family looped-hinge helix DNA binding protein
MNIVKCGEKGQVAIPRALLDRLGITENTPMLLHVTEDGAIVLRRAAVLPVEIYSDARIAEFEHEGDDDRAAARAARCAPALIALFPDANGLRDRTTKEEKRRPLSEPAPS